MAGNARFHDKFHSKNHHTSPTIGYADSASDPIASPSNPFQGDFHINGTLSANGGIIIPESVIVGNITANNAIFDGIVKMDYLSGETTESILSDSPLTIGNGLRTLTIDFLNGCYFKNVVNIASNVYCASGIEAKSLVVDNIIINDNANIDGNVTVGGNVSMIGSLTSNKLNLLGGLTADNSGTQTSIFVNQLSAVSNINPLIVLKGNSVNKFVVDFNGNVSASGNVIGTNISLLQSTSSNWNETRTIVNQFSGFWLSAYNILNFSRSFWDTSYTNLTSNSANWNASFTVTTANSANWISTFTNVTSNSANWNASYTVTTANSANWISSYILLTSTSANWNSNYSSVNSNSANWDASFTNLTSNSANWNSTYTTVTNSSAAWLSGDSTLNHQSSSIKTLILSSGQTIYNPVTSIVLAAANVNLSATTPSFISVTNATGAEQINLPTGLNSSGLGLTFTIKNNTTTNNHFHVHYNGSLMQTVDQYQKYQFIWNGTTWLVF